MRRRCSARSALRAAALLASLIAANAAADERQPLPDGGVARASAGDIRSARYVDPTTRYAHGILGDRIEAGGLEVRGAGIGSHILQLPNEYVFEDLTPRIVDLDGDGRNEVVTIRAHAARGAGIALYGLRDGKLVELSASREIGQANRWLNPAAIIDVDGDGTREVLLVRTPHIGGVLEIWSYQPGMMARRATFVGVSNHEIGSRALNLSAMMDVNGDGRDELILPDQPRSTLVALSVRPWTIEVVARASLGAGLAGDFRMQGGTLMIPLKTGGTAHVTAEDFR